MNQPYNTIGGNRNFVQLFQKYEPAPLLRKVGKGETTFIEELTGFYDISHKDDGFGRGGRMLHFSLGEANQGKVGTTPDDLGEILKEIIGSKTIDEETRKAMDFFNERASLEYAQVRDNLDNPIGKPNHSKRVTSAIRYLCSGLAAATIGIPLLAYGTTGHVEEAIVPLASIYAISAAGLIIPHLAAPQRISIFHTLFYAAEEADRFREHYVVHCMFK